MDKSELFFKANEQLQLSDLIIVTEDIYNNLNKSNWNDITKDLSYEDWVKELTEAGYDVSKIHYNPKGAFFQSYFYVGDYSATELQILDPDWLKNPFSIGCLKVDDVRKKTFLNKEYEVFFFPEWNKFAIDYFIRLYKEIETDVIWKVFKDMYISAEYGFHMFPEDVLEYVFSFSNKEESIRLVREQGNVDKDGYITIYRGEGERSTNIEKALSWTLSLNIANRFANTYGEGKVYKGKVKADKIISYTDDRNEKEIIVRFRDIENIIWV